MKGISLKVLFAFISLLVVSCSTRSSLEVDGLQCENLNEPLGIDNTSPHFSWVLNSKEQGAEQTAYQILVAYGSKSICRKEKQTCGIRERWSQTNPMGFYTRVVL